MLPCSQGSSRNSQMLAGEWSQTQGTDLDGATESTAETQAGAGSQPQDTDLDGATESTAGTQARAGSQPQDTDLDDATKSATETQVGAWSQPHDIDSFGATGFITRTHGLGQPNARNGSAPAALSRGGDGDARPSPEYFSLRKFKYITECTCGREIPQTLKSGLDEMWSTCEYADIEDILPEVYRYGDKLCPRHCQILLVKVLGRRHLVHKTDRQSLQDETRQLIPKLQHCFQNNLVKMNFTMYKRGFWFCWDLIDEVIVPGKDRERISERSASDGGKPKRKRVR